MKRKDNEQELAFKQKDFDLIRQKMSDPNFVQDQRQDLIHNIYVNSSYDSTINLDNVDGKDCIVAAIDNLIETMVGDNEAKKVKK